MLALEFGLGGALRFDCGLPEGVPILRYSSHDMSRLAPDSHKYNSNIVLSYHIISTPAFVPRMTHIKSVLFKHNVQIQYL